MTPVTYANITTTRELLEQSEQNEKETNEQWQWI